MSRCVIVSAGLISAYKKISSFFRNDDYFIFCDGGLNHLPKLSSCAAFPITPSYIVGDFDSFDKNKINQIGKNLELENGGATTEILVLPREKDDTDTFAAVKLGLKMGFSDFLLLGVLGNRFDHSLCNISALIYLHNHGVKASIIDDFSEIEVLGTTKELMEKGIIPLENMPVQKKKYLADKYGFLQNGEIPDSYSYFSLMNIAGDVSGVTIKNAKYPLENDDIKAEFSLGVSNEVLPGKVAEVTVEKGLLLLVKVW